MKNGKDVPSVKRERQHNWWRYLLTFLGGFFACIGVIVGGLAITGTAVKLGDLVAMTGNNPADILGENYRNDTLLTFIQKMSSKKFETLGDINEISPKIESIVKDTINPVLKENIKFEFDWDELKIKPFEKNESSTRPATEYDKTESIAEYIPRVFKATITLASFVDPDGTATGVLRYFLYPYSGGVFDTNNPYSIGTFADSGPDFFNDIINNIKVGDIIDTSGNAFLSQMAEWGLSEFTDEKIKTLKIGPLFSDEEKAANPLLNAIATKDWSIADLSNMDNINALKIGEIVDTSGMTSGLLYAIRENTIADLQEEDFIDGLNLGDIFPGSTGIMGTLISHGFTVGDLSDDTAIKSLTLEEVLGEIPSTSILYDFRETALNDVDDIDVSTVKLTSIFSETQIETNKILNAIWENNHDVTVGDLSDPDTISNLAIEDVIDCSGSLILEALVSKGATIGNLSEKVELLTLTDVIDIGTDPDAIIYKIATSTALSGVTISEIGDHFDELTIGDILAVDSSSPQLIKTLEDVQLKDLGTRMNSLTASDVILIGGPEDPFYAIKDTPVSDSAALMEAIKENLKLKDVAEIDESSPEVLKSLQNTTLTDIPTVLTTLTLSEIITIESTSPQILKSLANVQVFGDGDNNLQYYLTHLKFNDYFTASDCSTGILKVLWDSTDPAGDFEISEIASKINDLKIIDVLADEIYCDPVVIQDGHKKIKPAWWYLLAEEGESFTSSEEYFILGNGKDYTMNDMNKLVTNMEYHMKNESLFNLIRAEFVTVTSAAMTKLETPIPLDPEGRRYGDLTISEFLNAAALFL